MGMFAAMGADIWGRRACLLLSLAVCPCMTAIKTEVSVCMYGRKQSPVDFPSCDRPALRNALEVTWAAQESVRVESTGATIRLTAGSATAPGGLRFQVAWADKRYTLKYCEIYKVSLHTVAGIQFPVEVHCVQTKDGSENHRGTLSIFFSLGRYPSPFFLDLDLTGVEGLESTAVSSSATEAEIIARRLSGMQPLDFNKLLHNMDLSRYYSYEGSGTFPPCSEDMDWYVLMGSGTLTQVQYDQITAAANQEGDFRVPQPFNSYQRMLYGCPTEHEKRPLYPYNAGSWAAYTEQTSDRSNRICATGSEQSPVDLPSCPSESQAELVPSWVKQPASLRVDERGIAVTAKGQERGGLVVGDDGSFALVGCVLHLGSEHTIASKQYALEVQCLHRAAQQDRHVTLALLFALDPALEGSNGFLESVIGATGGGDFEADFNRLLPDDTDLKQYWSYAGSDTLPPCAEDREWLVIRQTLGLSTAQHDALQNLARDGGAPARNFRPTQRRGSRVVLGCGFAASLDNEVLEDLKQVSSQIEEATQAGSSLDWWLTVLFFLCMAVLLGLGRLTYDAFMKKQR